MLALGTYRSTCCTRQVVNGGTDQFNGAFALLVRGCIDRLCSRSYFCQQKYQEAVDAYSKAVSLSTDNNAATLEAMAIAKRALQEQQQQQQQQQQRAGAGAAGGQPDFSAMLQTMMSNPALQNLAQNLGRNMNANAASSAPATPAAAFTPSATATPAAASASAPAPAASAPAAAPATADSETGEVEDPQPDEDTERFTQAIPGLSNILNDPSMISMAEQFMQQPGIGNLMQNPAIMNMYVVAVVSCVLYLVHCTDSYYVVLHCKGLNK
jgi:tetratricopeptide (TPR) repeat protein